MKICKCLLSLLGVSMRTTVAQAFLVSLAIACDGSPRTDEPSQDSRTDAKVIPKEWYGIYAADNPSCEGGGNYQVDISGIQIIRSNEDGYDIEPVLFIDTWMVWGVDSVKMSGAIQFIRGSGAVQFVLTRDASGKARLQDKELGKSYIMCPLAKVGGQTVVTPL